MHLKRQIGANELARLCAHEPIADDVPYTHFGKVRENKDVNCQDTVQIANTSHSEGLKTVKITLQYCQPQCALLRVLVAALWDKKLAFRTRERRKFWVFTNGPQRKEKKTSSEAMLQLNSASEKKSVLLKEDQTDL
ncbi:hypothetical protein TNCV_3489111 [Trichonephila clavipes]|nr:hypothetical protein TNCV_3489111 [Trichonephila clavipes]